jgi:hypothetical protein
MQWYAAVHSYSWNVGGRPDHSWPSFVPLTFELGVLGASLTGVVALFVFCRFPKPYHPVFNVEGFERASRDRFFLSIEQSDPAQIARAREELRTAEPLRIVTVPQ